MGIKISVIVPIYNMERFLNRCLDSIINQTYRNLEIILINDGSTDTSGDICDIYAWKDIRIKVIHQPNAGVSSARNAGIGIAKGDYISFIDPDDWIENNMYEILVKHIQEDSVDIIRFNAERKGDIINTLPFKNKYSGKEFESEIQLAFIGAIKFGGMFILGVLWLHIFRREVVEKNNIRFNNKLHRCEDRLFTLSVILNSENILFIDDILYHYEVNDNSLSNKYDPMRWEQELLYLEELQGEYKKCKGREFVTQAENRKTGEYLLRAITSINNEFFSANNRSFFEKYRNTKTIINNPNVRMAIKKTAKEKSGLKGGIILAAIKYRQPFLLSLFNTAILYKNKI